VDLGPDRRDLKQETLEMIDLNDPDAVCRSIGYFLDFLTLTVPVISMAIFAWRIAR
jgi:hypothetical protein